MGKMLLLLMAALSVGISVTLYTIQSGVLSGEHEVYQHAEEVLAREKALSGINDAAQTMLERYTKSITTPLKPINGGDKYGRYEVNIKKIDTNTFALHSVGFVDDVQYTVVRQYTFSATASTPPLGKRAITTDGNIQIKDDLVVTAGPAENSDLHANGNIELEGKNVSVQGFGHHGGNLVIKGGQRSQDIFKPNVNPNGLPGSGKAAKVKIANFKATQYRSKATQVITGDWNVGGRVALGTKDNPKIIYIEGNLKTTAPLTFDGYGMIVMKGNFEGSHPITQDHTSGQSHLGIYTEGNIILKQGGQNLSGFWYLNGNVILEEAVTFSGAIANLGNVIANKQASLRYQAPVSAITGLVWPTSSAGNLVLNKAQEWGTKPNNTVKNKVML